MSKWILAVCGLFLCLSAAIARADVYEVYNFGSGALYGAAPGMRFGDQPQVGSSVEPGFYGCPNCFGVQPHPCDPCWRGPCMDWKLIGWYSHWGGHGGCHKKRCCATAGSACCATTNGEECVNCQK